MEAYSPNTLEVVIEFILNEYFMNLLIIQCEYTRASHIILDYLQALTLKYEYNTKKKIFSASKYLLWLDPGDQRIIAVRT